ncbi:MAG: hypothetical protein A2785_00365 [Candidatus Chisholmbacteria bacterium RIFCSPHIGHO2_01_FULL_49_18]|uniref:Metalloprotease TldD/E C-terminal domain-containing protein n=1 Tax=Candidatus Chisholmbacteria bacterium RIFCSPHIGHO2_01_FULL_49_18 TaxID=1797590 RepID=A0A1G1VPL5_9BACT|nr:MAG: hypothetical protein A2785_00365 [Candidatus Chisholmbacteria bacterium RIFCSPHIGHO2_01_FULL_49_18]
MNQLRELERTVAQGLRVLRKEQGLIEGVVYSSSNRRSVGRLVYTSHIPCNGLEEPKSDEDVGICVELWFRKGRTKLIGYGQEPNELSVAAIRRAIAKARRDAVEDKDFVGFLKPKQFPRKNRRQAASGDPRLLSLDEKGEAELLARLSWETIAGAVERIGDYARETRQSAKQIAFILNGDHFIIRERMAMATTNGISDSEETTVCLSSLTAMLEKANAKGSAWAARNSLVGFSAYDIGRQAASSAIDGVGGVRVPGGVYPVIFGPQAVAELFGSLLLPHLTLGMVEFGASMYQGRYGKRIASPLLTLCDDATLPDGPGSKRITCEGFPTKRTLLIDKGKLTGFLSDSRTTNKVLVRRKESTGKLGIDPYRIRRAISPGNGFRFSRGGGRVAGAGVGIHATNLIVDTPKPLSEKRLLNGVKNGIYIGRLWYTYPVGGYASGIISGTAIADCYRIRNGKLAEPIVPNSLRLEDHLGQMMSRITGIGDTRVPTILWASDEITHAPWVAVKDVNFLAINETSTPKTPPTH